MSAIFSRPRSSRAARLHPGSIGGLLVVWVGSAIALFALLYWLTSGYLLHQVDERLNGEVAEFQSIGRDEAIATISALSRRDVADSRPYGLFDGNGRRLAGNVDSLPAKKDGKPFDYAQATREGRSPVMSQYRGIIVPKKRGLRIGVGHSIDEIIVCDRTLVTTLCTGLALTILLAVGCGAALNRMSNRRIRAISETSREIMAGQLDPRLPTRLTNHDLDRLPGDVNPLTTEKQQLMT